MSSLCPPPLERGPSAARVGAYTMERTLRVTHDLNYRYDAPVRDVSTQLRLLPPPVRGMQRLRNSVIDIAPLPAVSRRAADPFGNEMLDLRHEKIWKYLTLVVEMEVETGASYDAGGHVLPAALPAFEGTPPEGTDAFLAFTPLTTPNADLGSVAREIVAETSGEDPLGRAGALCRRVYHEMRYASGSTTIRTTAEEAWATRRGVCQDYAHVLSVLCRLADLPARYVSGFLPGEGAMHAWVEVLLPDGDGRDAGWVALDPTHDRWVSERYVTVAVGRDYADITPNSGTFVGRVSSSLSHPSRVEVVRTTRTDL